jgi:Rieske Fe-S protein
MTDTRSDSCGGCDVGRRTFLRDAAIAVAAFATVGATRAEAMPIAWIDALARSGKDVSYAIPAKDGVSIDKTNEVILARVGKNVYAFGLSCPHQNTALKWLDSDHRFQCPKHKSKYGPDGVYLEGRATRSMDRFQVKLVGTGIAVNLDKLYEEDQDVKEWKTAFVTV